MRGNDVLDIFGFCRNVEKGGEKRVSGADARSIGADNQPSAVALPRRLPPGERHSQFRTNRSIANARRPRPHTAAKTRRDMWFRYKQREREGPRRDFSGGPGVVLCGLSARQPQQQSEFARRAFSSYLNYLARRPGDWLRIRNERFGMSRACASPVICKFTWPRECILHGASGRTNFRMIAWAHRRRGRRADAYNGSIYFPELDGPIGYYMLVSVTCIASYSTIQPPTLQWK